MNVLMLSLEHPHEPKSGLGVHLNRLISYLKLHINVTVCTPSRRMFSYAQFEDFIADANFTMVQHVLSCNKRFDLIHAHDDMTAPAAHDLKQRLGLPLAATIHGLESERKKACQEAPHPYRLQTERLLLESADELIVLSTFMKRALDKAARKKITVIPSPASLEEEKGQIPRSMNKRFLFSFGRFVPEKGFSQLLKVFAILRQRQPDLHLVMAGEGPSVSSYEKLAAALNLKEHVMFLPFLHRRDLRAFLSRCEMAVFPSFYEPFGLAAQESMEQGVLTAVSQSGGFCDYAFHDKTAIAVDFTHAQEAADLLDRFLKDREKARRIKEAGKQQVIKLHDPRLITASYLQLYERIINNSTIH
ncbi:glycosyltransferase family 4 protein [Bacillus spizizenii]|uniref:glycosyltransferase family 4 protein n=1 Tax=Bacillus spizizenii TaxID=96241 RepID=UPI0005CA7FAD|nr:glycosyltransferase family 4 protein [Bacillus spizizenii]MCY8128897.1 glycosyltransferase family 4 protein [Bacillus spizizenii]MCY8761646.1 glycosyltransferase family 4 protein [Bacillus spizizenii]MCY8783044.1 glycosyltransferase family 4 protein [Bacillus spizizenii]MEC0564833.1 glycosyltransferase family 4 protein [Bacillus spizizenii]MEC1569752.1 glycosyltransferase family 4 protein [Bacillus spizizenii]